MPADPPLVRPVGEWPDLLCGPILRRVTSQSVTVFAAFKTGGDVELTVRVKGSGTWLSPTASKATCALGNNLHVCAIESRPNTALTPNVVYEYQLRFQATGSTTWKGLKELQVLDGLFPLGYQQDALPTFALPPDLKDLKILYGSCRKPHGPGPDALVIVDDLIKDKKDLPLQRPHQLLLGGDQIYADDVSLALLKTLTKTAEKLLEGWSHIERIPAVAEGGFVDWNSTLVDPGPSRGTFVKNQTNLSTGEREGHLLFLGEFFAMYLFAWSDALWLRNVDGRPTLPLAENFPHLTEAFWPWEIFDQTKQDKARKHFDEQRARALRYARALPQVRRVLANVPTYMIFDDHEVTDDWFIDGPWDADVREDLASRQVVRNGLLAYAVFQDWGNHPEHYASAPARTVLDSIKYSEGVDPVILAMPNACDWFLDIREISQARPDAQHRMIWDFDVEGPQHVIIALDTRTWRFYPSRTRKGHAGLISSESMDRQIDARRLRFPNKLPIIISAAPVVGHPIIEVAQEVCVETDLPLFLGPSDTKVTRFDFEAWTGRRTTFEDFLGRIAKFGRAVVVSGDVHYAFSNQLAYFPDGLAPSRIVQLCSSAFKNESFGTHIIGSAGYAGIRKIGWLGFNEDLSAPMRQQLLETLQSGMAKDSVGAFISRLYHELIVAQRLYKPAVIPSGPWMTPQATAIVSALADNPNGQQSRTNWRYSVEYLEDVRPETQRKDDAGIQATYLATTEHGARTVAFDSSRRVVGDNNVGRITFVTDAGGSPTLLVHRLYWDARTPDGSRMLGPVMFTETRAPLTAPSAAERPTVTQ